VCRYFGVSKQRELVNVLVVEDELFVREVAHQAIEAAGFKAYAAANADEAISILERQRNISIVFTDINMPGSMDGIGLAHCVRDRWPPVQFIVTSALSKFRDAELPRGSVFVSKPYSPEQIVQKIEKMSEATA
jgi:two-component system, response regulator PdtaR